MTERPAVVVDIGSGSIKAGFAGDKLSTEVPSRVGLERSYGLYGAQYNANSRTFIGEELQGKYLNYRYPIERGRITDRFYFEKLLEYTFSQLQVDTSEYAMLFTDTPFNTKSDRIELLTLMFETYHIPAICLANSAVLSLLSTGLSTGLVLDSGHGASYAMPIYEGHLLPSVSKLQLGGIDVTEMLRTLLNSSGCSFTTSSECLMINNIKEKHAAVALDSAKTSTSSSPDPIYELPDGTLLSLGQERFECAEVLFGQRIDQTGLQHMITNAIAGCDLEFQKELLQSVVLSGGATLLPGFVARMQKELSSLHSSTVNVIAPTNRIHSAWIGGSIFASHPSFPQRCISRADYNEFGPSIVK